MAIVKSNGSRMHLILGLALSVALFITVSTACQQAEEVVSEDQIQQEGKLVFEGTAKLVIGKFLFMSEAQGFDIVVQGSVEGGDAAGLLDKEIKVEGEINSERPSVLVADTIEVKEAGGEFRNVFTRTEEVVLDEYLSLQARDGYEALLKLAHNENDGWEGKEKVKIYGVLQQQEDSIRIQVLDDEDKQVGFVIVDSMSDYANFYLQKLPLFEKFWFYLDVKETIPWNVRRRSRELFHADVLFAGLF